VESRGGLRVFTGKIKVTVKRKVGENKRIDLDVGNQNCRGQNSGYLPKQAQHGGENSLRSSGPAQRGAGGGFCLFVYLISHQL